MLATRISHLLNFLYVSFSKILNYFINHKLFSVLVLLPSFLAFIYFLFVSSDIYYSEAQILIRQAEKQTFASGLGSLFQSFGLSNTRNDVYVVREYVISRDVLKILNENLDLSRQYSNKNIDFFQRFNPIGQRGSFEDFFEYYKKIVSVDIDSTSTICTIKIKAFAPKLAQEIVNSLIFLSEGMINELNRRANRDIVLDATLQLDQAKQDLIESSLALAEFRSRESFFDPNQQSSLQLQKIYKLQVEVLNLKNQISQLKLLARDSALIKSLEKKYAELQDQIMSETKQLSGDYNSMAKIIPGYERLELEKNFFEKKMLSAFSSFEQAKEEYRRQKLYLDVISTPSLQDEAMYPRRILDILLVVGVSLLVYGSFFILKSGTEEHRS